MLLNRKGSGKFQVLAHDESGCAWLDTTVYEGDGLVYPVATDVSIDEANKILDNLEERSYHVTRYLQRKKLVLDGGSIIDQPRCPVCGNHLKRSGNDVACSYIKCNFSRKDFFDAKKTQYNTPQG